MFRQDSDKVLRVAELERFSWLRHGFGTRLSPAWHTDANSASSRQIHSDRVLMVESPGPQGDGDALITNRPGIGLSVRTADCLPVLIADPSNRAVAAIHAGWRGVVSEIVPKTITALARQFGSKPDDLTVAIGPGIGPCCFEVGPEVAEKFGTYFPERDLTVRARIDLAATLCRQLGRNGVSMSQIFLSSFCTFCDSELFESYRRDKEKAGRMIAGISLTGEE